jgi:hypothetical protein
MKSNILGLSGMSNSKWLEHADKYSNFEKEL